MCLQDFPTNRHLQTTGLPWKTVYLIVVTWWSLLFFFHYEIFCNVPPLITVLQTYSIDCDLNLALIPTMITLHTYRVVKQSKKNRLGSVLIYRFAFAPGVLCGIGKLTHTAGKGNL